MDSSVSFALLGWKTGILGSHKRPLIMRRGEGGQVHHNAAGAEEGARGKVGCAPEVGGWGVRIPAVDISGRMSINGEAGSTGYGYRDAEMSPA